MNEIYNFIVGELTDPLQQVFAIVIFFMIVEALFGFMSDLLGMGGKR